MIRNYDDLEEAREQLGRIESILLSWHRELWDKNRRNYYLYADGAIAMMLKLRAEVDQFLGITEWHPDEDESAKGTVREQPPAEPANGAGDSAGVIAVPGQAQAGVHWP